MKQLMALLMVSQFIACGSDDGLYLGLEGGKAETAQFPLPSDLGSLRILPSSTIEMKDFTPGGQKFCEICPHKSYFLTIDTYKIHRVGYWKSPISVHDGDEETIEPKLGKRYDDLPVGHYVAVMNDTYYPFEIKGKELTKFEVGRLEVGEAAGQSYTVTPKIGSFSDYYNSKADFQLSSQIAYSLRIPTGSAINVMPGDYLTTADRNGVLTSYESSFSPTPKTPSAQQ